MNREIYLKPELILTDLMVEGFVCASYPIVQVDEWLQEGGTQDYEIDFNQ